MANPVHPQQHPEQLVQSGPAVVPELGETLRVVSRDTTTLRFQWNSRVYVIPAGGEAYLPFDAVKCYLGDPRATANVRSLRDSIGIVSFLPDRETEVRRLRLLYMAPFGEYMAADSAGGIFQPTRPTTPTALGSNAFEGVRVPQVEVYNIQNQRILTVLDDPEGLNALPAVTTSAQATAQTHVIEQQQTLIKIMAERLGIDPVTGLANSPDVTGEVPPDDEEHVTDASVSDHVPSTLVPDDDDIERHPDGTPVMVLDPTDNQIKPKRRAEVHDPTSFDDLPADKI